MHRCSGWTLNECEIEEILNFPISSLNFSESLRSSERDCFQNITENQFKSLLLGGDIQGASLALSKPSRNLCEYFVATPKGHKVGDNQHC